MKKYICGLVSVVLFLVHIPLVSAGSFTDVTTSSPHYTAISSLRDRGIIQGFPDGSFRPDQPVTRAEILKIAIEGAHIDTSSFINESPGFTDVSFTHTLKKYIAYASRAGIVNGYGDGRYGPENIVTRGEAPKIVLRLNNIAPSESTTQPYSDTPLSLDLTKYIRHASDTNIVADTGSTYRINDGMTRGDVAEMMYRLLTIREQNLDRFPDPIPTDIAAINGTIDQGFFEHILLDTPLPRTFVVREVYTITGKLTTKLDDTFTVFLTNRATQTQEYFQTKVEGDRFEIAIPFNQYGTYDIGMIPGSSGSSRVMSVAVIGDPRSTETLPKPSAIVSGLSVSHDNNQTVLHWSTNGNALSKVSISQGARRVEHMFNNGVNTWAVHYREFEGFTEGPVTWTVAGATSSDGSVRGRSSAWSATQSNSFTATQHHFSGLDTDRAQVVSGAWQVDGPGTVAFRIKAIAPLFSDVYVITPAGLIEVIETSSDKTVATGKTMNFSVNIEQAGTYILEVNDTNSIAVINAPIYVGTDIPLIPDFQDLETRYAPVNNKPLTAQQRSGLINTMFNNINTDRQASGLRAVTLDTDLSGLAQAHTDDMVLRKFFSHTNPDGDGPGDRATARGITAPISENLASADTIESARFGLMRSAIHRQNILNSQWSRVGIGIAVDAHGNLVIAQEFSVQTASSGALSDDVIMDLRTNLIDEINDARRLEGNQYLKHNVVHEETVQSWLEEHPDGDLEDLIPRIRDGKQVSLWSVTAYYYPGVETDIVAQEPDFLTESKWNEIGIGIVPIGDRLKVIAVLIDVD